MTPLREEHGGGFGGVGERLCSAGPYPRRATYLGRRLRGEEQALPQQVEARPGVSVYTEGAMTRRRLEAPVGATSEAEAHRKVLDRVAQMSPDEIFQWSVKAGVYTKDGQLTPEYGGKRRP
jgi:hypothetical protein